jgi:hypothetical protein
MDETNLEDSMLIGLAIKLAKGIADIDCPENMFSN